MFPVPTNKPLNGYSQIFSYDISDLNFKMITTENNNCFTDNSEIIDYMVDKVLNLRIYDDEAGIMNKSILKDFHDEILEGYLELLDGEKNALFKMKELWAYMIHMFSDNKKYFKAIKKSQNLINYEAAVSSLFMDQDIIEGSGLFGE